MGELRRAQQQFNSYMAALGAETVARSGLVRQLRNMLTQQACPPPWADPLHSLLRSLQHLVLVERVPACSGPLCISRS